MAKVLWVTPVIAPMHKYREALAELLEGDHQITYLRKVGLTEDEILRAADSLDVDFIVVDAAPGVDIDVLAQRSRATIIRPVRELVPTTRATNHIGPGVHRFCGYRTVAVGV